MTRKIFGISRRTWLGCAASSYVLASGVRRARAADPIQLRLATADNMQDTPYQVGLRFADAVARRTNGKYKISMFGGSALGSATNLGASLQTGILDCAILTAGFLESFVSSVQVIDLPFIFKDEDHAARTLDGEVGRRLFADMEAKNIIGLAWGWFGWRNMETRDKAVVTPNDLRGLRMRIQPGAVFAAMFKALGAIPIAIDGSEVYLALAQKTVDGLEFPLPTAASFKVYEVTKHVAMTKHVYNAGPLMISKARWSQLTDDDREAFRTSAQEVLPFWRANVVAATTDAETFLKSKGMQTSETDYPAFRAKMQPVYDEYRPRYQTLFDMITAQQT
jgi:TRAP-type transport system periplasmic protein